MMKFGIYLMKVFFCYFERGEVELHNGDDKFCIKMILKLRRIFIFICLMRKIIRV